MAVVWGTGCTWNALQDHDIDQQVARTCFRSVARGAVSPFQAMLFTAMQFILSLHSLDCCLSSAPTTAFPGSSSLPSTTMERVTSYPQFVLAPVSTWDVLLALPAFGLDISTTGLYQKVAESHFVGHCACLNSLDIIYAFRTSKVIVKTASCQWPFSKSQALSSLL